MPSKYSSRTSDGRKAERWADVPGYEGYYQVSDAGRVKSLKRTVPMRDGRTYRVGGKILRTKPGPGGYTIVCLSKDGTEWGELLHRLVLAAFVGPCPPGMECCHEDGDPADNRLENLRWDTKTSNQQDRRKHGTWHDKTAARGHRHGMAKLQEAEARQIKYDRETSHDALAERFGVTTATIRDIQGGKSWRHI